MMVVRDIHVLYEEAQNNEINSRISEFVKAMGGKEQSAEYYEDKRKTLKEKALEDIALGKKSEFFVATALRENYGYPPLDVDLEIRNGSDKGWKHDLPFGEVDPRFPSVHVKSCNDTTVKYCGDYSWTFQVEDKIFGEDTGLVALCYARDWRYNAGVIKAILPWQKLKRHLKDPIKDELKGIKRCVYYKDIMIPTLVNDNAVELLKEQGKQATFRAAKDDTEFFSLLKQKLLSDIQKMTDAKDFEKKLDLLIDAKVDLDVFVSKIRTILKAKNRDINEEINRRLNKTGGFSKRIVIEGVAKLQKDYSVEVEEIKRFGEENGYPSMNLARNEKGQVYMTFVPGKESWDKFSKPGGNEDTFLKLLEAVRRKDINEGEGERKITSG